MHVVLAGAAGAAEKAVSKEKGSKTSRRALKTPAADGQPSSIQASSSSQVSSGSAAKPKEQESTSDP